MTNKILYDQMKHELSPEGQAEKRLQKEVDERKREDEAREARYEARRVIQRNIDAVLERLKEVQGDFVSDGIAITSSIEEDETDDWCRLDGIPLVGRIVLRSTRQDNSYRWHVFVFHVPRKAKGWRRAGGNIGGSRLPDRGGGCSYTVNHKEGSIYHPSNSLEKINDPRKVAELLLREASHIAMSA